MRGVLAAVMGALALGTVSAHAQSWRPIEQSCDRYLESRYHPGAVADPGWRWLAECTVGNLYARTPEMQRRLDQCVRHVEDARAAQRLCEACGRDPIAATIACMGGASG